MPGQWERGEKVPSIKNLEALAKLLGVSTSWLIGESVSETSDDYSNHHAGGNTLSKIRTSYAVCAGLRNLAMNNALIDALKITNDEWDSLYSLKTSKDLTAEAFVSILMIIRNGDPA